MEDSERETFLFHRGKQLSVIVLQKKSGRWKRKTVFKKNIYQFKGQRLVSRQVDLLVDKLTSRQVDELVVLVDK